MHFIGPKSSKMNTYEKYGEGEAFCYVATPLHTSGLLDGPSFPIVWSSAKLSLYSSRKD